MEKYLLTSWHKVLYSIVTQQKTVTFTSFIPTHVHYSNQEHSKYTHTLKNVIELDFALNPLLFLMFENE